MTSRPTITTIRLVELDDGRAWDVPRRGCCRLCDREFPSPATMPDDRLCLACTNRIASWARIADWNLGALGCALCRMDPPWVLGELIEVALPHDLMTPCPPLPAWARFPGSSDLEALHV